MTSPSFPSHCGNVTLPTEAQFSSNLSSSSSWHLQAFVVDWMQKFSDGRTDFISHRGYMFDLSDKSQSFSGGPLGIKFCKGTPRVKFWKETPWVTFCKGGPLWGEIENVGGSTVSNSSPHEWIFRKFTFLPEKNLLQNFKLFKKSFPATRDDFAYIQVWDILEMLSMIFCFCHPFLFSSFGFIFLLDLFWENIYDRVKSNFENIGCSDLLFKVSVFVLRCIFGYYRHRARKLARNLTIGQSLSNSCFSKFWKC